MKILKSLAFVLFALSSLQVRAEDPKDFSHIFESFEKDFNEDFVSSLIKRRLVLNFLSILSTNNPLISIPGIYQTLPYLNLTDHLDRLANHLGNEEKTQNALAQDFPIFNLGDKESLSEKISRCLESGNIDLKAAAKYPFTIETYRIQLAKLLEIKKIFEDLLEIKISDDRILHSSKSLNQFLLSKITDTKELVEFVDLLRLVCEDEITRFRQFMDENKEKFENLSDLAKNNFKARSSEKICKTVRGTEFCTERFKESSDQLKSFAEINSYLKSLPPRPVIVVNATKVEDNSTKKDL